MRHLVVVVAAAEIDLDGTVGGLARGGVVEQTPIRCRGVRSRGRAGAGPRAASRHTPKRTMYSYATGRPVERRSVQVQLAAGREVPNRVVEGVGGGPVGEVALLAERLPLDLVSTREPVNSAAWPSSGTRSITNPGRDAR